MWASQLPVSSPSAHASQIIRLVASRLFLGNNDTISAHSPAKIRATRPNIGAAPSMACGRFLNCTLPSHTLQGDPDILSYGVTVAFIMSAVMTMTAVLAAYLSDSMPGEILSETDEMFIPTFQKRVARLVARPCLTKILHIWSSVWTRMFRRHHSQPRQPLSRKQREAAVTRFILALSDQQLVVGLAILIAITGNQCTISVAEYEVAFSLAWFSITTHLATLDSLRRYFTIHTTVRNIRVFGMVVVMAFFCYSFVVVLIAQSVNGATIPIQCYINREVNGKLGFGYITLVPWTITVWMLIVGYKNGILQSFGHSTTGASGPGFITAKLKFMFLRLFLGKAVKDLVLGSVEWKPLLEEFAREDWAKDQRHYLEVYMLSEAREHIRSRVFETYIYPMHAYLSVVLNVYQRSVLPVAPFLTFMLTYGFTQLILFRWLLPAFEDVKSMAFGQITPLALLTLPMLAAAEIYYESRQSNELVHTQNAISISSTHTLPFASSADIADPHLARAESSSRAFDSNLKLVKRYFYREKKEIHLLCISVKNEDDWKNIVRLKANIWALTMHLHEKDQVLRISRSVICFHLLFTIIAGVIGVLLNLPDRGASVTAGFLMWIHAGAKIFSWMKGNFKSTDQKTHRRLLSDMRKIPRR